MSRYVAKEQRELIKTFYKNNIDTNDNLSDLGRAFVEAYPDIDITLEAVKRHFYRLQNNEDKGTVKKKTNLKDYEQVIEESKDSKIIEQKTDKQITSLEDAIKFFKVDTEIWEIVTWKCKSWGTSMKLEEIADNGRKITTPITKVNYLVSVNLKKKKAQANYDKIYKQLDDWGIKPIILHKGSGKGVGVLTIADLHTGLKTSSLNGTVATPDYNIEILVKYLTEIAEKVNQLNYKELHVIILGDLVESVSGYNHLETLKEMEYGITGGNLIMVAYEIIKKFIASLLNVKKLYFISGNHDRLTPDSRMDQEGGAAQIIAYMMNMSVPTLFHSLIMNVIIDNISYILTHGHLKIAKADIGKIVFQYGKQEIYNVILEAHLHHRKVKRAVAKEEQMIPVDTNKYRMITVPSITTGNRWSESMGFGSTGGFTILEANTKKNNINHLDFSL